MTGAPDPKQENVYRELVDRIIESQVSLYGFLAVAQARKVKGLLVSEDGKVLGFSGPPCSVVCGLFEGYGALGGKLSSDLVKSILVVYKEAYPELELACLL